MKKCLVLFLSFLMVFSIFSFSFAQKTEAQSSLGCEAYELAWVNDSGGFDTVACYSSFSEASSALTDDDYVIRHAASKSPTKIIAIASGVAYSYPMRSGSSTMDIFQREDYETLNQKYKSTYVVQHRELFQPHTVSYNGKGEGNVKTVLNGFEGYAKLSEMDLVPMKFIALGLTITLGGQTAPGSIDEQPFQLIPKMSYYSVEQNGNYTDLVYRFYSGYDSKEYKLIIGQAAEWMSVGAVYYSKDGVNFYSDRNMTNYLASYYNYYMYLPLRSLSSISGDTFDAYLKSKGYTEKPTSTSINHLKKNQSQLVSEGSSFVNAQNTYGVNALMVYAMACLESGYGTSNYAVSRNNLFGWNAIDADPNQASSFLSIEKGVREHMAYNLRVYMDIFDVRYFGMHVGNKASGFNVKYASDPYWGAKIASIAYDIDKFSKDYDGTYSDLGTYSLGVIEEFDAPFMWDASSTSGTMFTAKYSSYYQNNHTVIIHGETNGYYQVQSPNAILENQTILKHKVDKVLQDAKPYSMTRSVGYLLKEHVSVISEIQEVTIPGYEPTDEFVFEIDEFEINEEGLILVAGQAYRPGIYVTDSNILVHSLEVYNQDFDVMNEVRFETTLVQDSKDQARFDGTIDIDSLQDGDYYFRLNTDYSSLQEFSDSRVLSIECESYESETKQYQFEVVNDVLWMKVKTKEVLNPDNYTLISSLKSIQLNESVLSLKGISVIRKLDHEQDRVSHELIAVNTASNEEILLGSLTPSTGDYNLSEVYEDGFAYDYGWYDGSVDISQLPSGNYILLVRTTVDGCIKESKIYGTSKMKGSDSIEGEDGLFRQLVMRYAVSYRVELSVVPYSFEIEVKNQLPRIREGYQNLISMKFDESSNTLNVLGSAFIWNAEFDESSEAEYTLYALNRIDGSVYSTTVEGKNTLLGEEPPWNNTERVDSGYNYDYTWYEFTLPIDQFTAGEYDFVLMVETKDYVEYIDLKKSSSSGLGAYQSDSLDYSISVDRNNKNRVTMIVAELSVINEQ